MDIPRYISNIIQKIEQHGFEAYIVGGAVRDFLMGKTPIDYDLASSATPEELEKIFADKKLITIGKKFGTVMIIEEAGRVEITTYRREAEYLGYENRKVEFTENIREDLERRDLPSMLWHIIPRGLLDFYEGRKDFKRCLRTVGDASVRFREDILRILRAVRFCTVLDFVPAPEMLESARELAYLIPKLSGERIASEMEKILLSDQVRRGLYLLDAFGALSYVFPSVKKMKNVSQEGPYHSEDVFNHTISVVEKKKSDLEIRLAALYHDAGKPDTKFLDENGNARFFGHEKRSVELFYEDIGSWHLPKRTMENIGFLIHRHMACCNPYTKKHVNKLLRESGKEEVEKLFLLQEADMLSTSTPNLQRIEEGRSMVKCIEEEKNRYQTDQMALNGHDLIAMGFQEGKPLGDCLRAMRAWIDEHPHHNNRKDLTIFVKEWIRRRT